MKKYLNLIFISVISLATVYLLFRTNEIVNILKAFEHAHKWLILVSVLMMGFYLLLEALMMHILLNLEGGGYDFKISVKSMFIGQFYSLLTPFATGGQPMQLIALIQDGISGVHATAVLVNKFLYFQVGVTLYSLVLVIIRFDKTIALINATYGIIAIGLIFNFVGLAVVLLMIYNPSLIKRIIDFVIGIFSRLHSKKIDWNEKKRRWYNKVDETTQSVKMMMFHKKTTLKLVLYTFLQLTCFFSITYFIYRAFDLRESSFLDILTMQSILYMSIALLPAPGSAGVAEGGFFIIFGSVFPSQYISGALLIWRGITYYVNLIVSATITLFTDFRRIARKK